MTPLHLGGNRDPDALSGTLRLTGEISGKCLIFVDDVVTTGATFKSIQNLLDYIASVGCGSAYCVYRLAIAKTCSNCAEHNSPRECEISRKY
ncbi:phosphoribosyltransferase [archaeon]|nr:MAG: phosphoribosyltransferase [archaeon]